jgi:predicted AAA+ superfamily ATPase
MNKNSSQGYIELNRKYAKFQDYHLFSKPESIDVVLKENDAVVILGDKGSGKTTEIKQFQSKHRKHRDNSIYFDLKDIYLGFQDVKSRIESLIKSVDLKNDGSYLYLLFDSIDECRLQDNRQQDAFETALQKIKNDLANQSIHISKIKFIFTSREAGWKKDTDENLIKEYLSINMLEKTASLL